MARHNVHSSIFDTNMKHRWNMTGGERHGTPEVRSPTEIYASSPLLVVVSCVNEMVTVTIAAAATTIVLPNANRCICHQTTWWTCNICCLLLYNRLIILFPSTCFGARAIIQQQQQHKQKAGLFSTVFEYAIDKTKFIGGKVRPTCSVPVSSAPKSAKR